MQATAEMSNIQCREEFLQTHMMLVAPNVYSGNISDLAHLSNQLEEIAQIDRLPTSNTLQAMYMLRQAWDQVGVFDTHMPCYYTASIVVCSCVFARAWRLKIVCFGVRGCNAHMPTRH